MRWTTEQIEELDRLVTSGWDWNWPGWRWVARKMESAFSMPFSVGMVKAKATRMYAKERARIVQAKKLR